LAIAWNPGPVPGANPTIIDASIHRPLGSQQRWHSLGWIRTFAPASPVLAESQSGYFTTAQARAAGVYPVRLVQLERNDDIKRLSRGVYRLARYPISRFGQYMEASLWPQVRRPEMRGTISHESALALYGLSDISPSKVHITLPPALRIRRTPPARLVIPPAHRRYRLPQTETARSHRSACRKTKLCIGPETRRSTNNLNQRLLTLLKRKSG